MENGETRKKSNAGKIFVTLFVIALIGGLAGLGYMYYQTRQELKFLASPDGQEALAKRSTDQVVDALSKLALLPEEEPVIATITDVAALASQSAFYLKAENGDKLVVFPQAQQAYIYSPGRNKIVNVGPLIIEGNQDGSAPAVEEEETTQPTTRTTAPSTQEETTTQPAEDTTL
jgi:hypothetical protein